MTKDAQGALRRTMETFSDVTRFCLVCNYVSRIIEPLASRCAKMRFAPLDAESMRDRLNVIATAENVTYREEVYKMILHCSKGDMRRAVTLLQSCVNFYGGGGGVMANALEEISGGVPTRLINALWTAVKKKDFDTMVTAVDNIMCVSVRLLLLFSTPIRKAIKYARLEGFPALACLIKIHDDVLADSAMSDAHKAAVCEVIAQADKNLADGADDHLQLHDISARILHL